MKRIKEGKTAILMAVYQGETFLREMIDSLLAQTCREFVIFFHDDGSTDASVSILSEYVRKDPEHFCLLEGEPLGSAKGNFLWMLSQVEADTYMFADQDDVWLPEKLEKSLAFYKKTVSEASSPLVGRYCCIFSDMYVTDETLHVLSDSMIRTIGRDIRRVETGQILMDNPAAGCTMFFGRKLRDEIVDAMERVDLSLVEMHDQFILATASLLGTVAGLEESLVYYRQHAKNEMGAKHENAASRLLRNLFDVFCGRFRREKQEFLQKSRDLGRELQKLRSLSKEQRDFLQNYAEIGKEKKYKRIAFYRAHHIERTTKLRTWWMYLWG